MNRYPVSSAALNSRPPAIIQAAHNFAWFVQALKDCEDRHDKEVDCILAAFKTSGTWREHYKTWDAACQYALGISKSYADKRIARSLGQTAHEGAKSTYKQDNQEQKALSQVEKARESEPPKEEEEKPSVHSADEVKRDESKPQNNGHAKSAPEPIKDCDGYAIPVHLLPTWERRQEVQDVMTLASKLKCAIETIYQKSDPLFRGGALNSQAHIASLGAIHYQLSQCKPGVVCPECNGDFKDDHGRECKKCRLTGFISEGEWRREYEKSNTSFVREKVATRNAAKRLSN